jgi:hypothetical protein
MREEDKPLTTMRTFMGSYQWTVMPFGLTNASVVFQPTMQRVLGAVIGKFVLVYLDDILIFSKTPEEHVQHVEFVLKRLAENKLYAQLHKCQFGMQQVEFVGHFVNAEGISVDPRKVQIVKNWPTPNSTHEVQQFQHLEGYGDIRICMNKPSEVICQPLTRKEVKWNKSTWTKQCQSSFELLKKKLTEVS